MYGMTLEVIHGSYIYICFSVISVEDKNRRSSGDLMEGNLHGILKGYYRDVEWG